jgi:hypothetical protein
VESGEARESAFVIDGKEYPVPGLDTFDMDERRVMFDYCGLTQEDFVAQEGETGEETEERNGKLMRHPGFLQSLMHIAYARGNPKVPHGRVKDVIGRTNFLEAVARFAEEEPEEADAVPPASESTSELEPSLPRSSVDSSESSGNGSPPTSSEPEETPEPTGAMRSGTYSPPSDPTT